MDKVSTLKKWFKEVWEKENSKTIFEIFVPEDDGMAHGLAKEKGIVPKEFEQFQKSLLKLIKEVRLSIDSYIENDDFIAADCTLNALDRKTGKKKIQIKGCVIAKITEGKIRTANNHFDFLHLFEALGLLPNNVFAKCLDGEKL